MVKVFVHGVPETEDIWGPLVTVLRDKGLSDDVVLLSPPGFGVPPPADWVATPSAYVDWLIAELERLQAERGRAGAGATIDIVGHDWGAGHVLGLLAQRPDLVHSWAVDCAGLLNPDYVWHDIAQQWQTPEAGEALVGAMAGLSLQDRTESYIGLGLTPDVAQPMAAGFDDAMGACILSLYRAATPPALPELADRLFATLDGLGPGAPSGLIIDATTDPYVASELAGPVAQRLGAATATLAGEGHWWMASKPAQETVASALLDHWAV